MKTNFFFFFLFGNLKFKFGKIQLKFSWGKKVDIRPFFLEKNHCLLIIYMLFVMPERA